MKTIKMLMSTALLTMFAAAAVFAQTPYYPSYGYPSYVCATPRQGMADMVSAAGSRNLSNSQAAINVTQARSQEMDNRLKGTENYFERKRVNEQYQAEHRPKRIQHAAISLPSPLSPEELDPVTGKVNWPPLLMQRPYEKYRISLDASFAAWAENAGSFTAKAKMEMQKAVIRLLNRVTGFAGPTPTSDYEAAITFVRALGHEADY